MTVAIRRFEENDAHAVSDMIKKTLRISNVPDYTPEHIETVAYAMRTEKLIEKSKDAHMYLVIADEKIVGCGTVGPYGDSESDAGLSTIFVLPDCQGLGIGRYILQTLEADEYFVRAKRVVLHASITASAFYLKFGYDYVGGQKELDENQLYPMEKLLQRRNMARTCPQQPSDGYYA